MNEERDLKLFEIMDELDVDMDTAELLLEDMEAADECED
jgi:orotate phosphoribosyltransferase-like protein